MDNRSNLINVIKDLQEQASMAYINLLSAEEERANQYDIERLQIEYNLVQSRLEQEQKNLNSMNNQSSTSQVFSKLSQSPAKNIPQTSAKPTYVFSEEENFSIKQHFEKLPKDLQALFNAALEDSNISLDTINNPVFLKGEGYIYDLSTVNEMLERNHGSCLYPRNQDKNFTSNDIIPCNTLISAKFHMLNIVKGNIYIPDPVEINEYSFAEENIALIKMIEAFYLKGLEPKHRILFDTICRDSFTNMIMHKPVFLPDGFVYDNKTAIFLLESSGESAVCPRNDKINFTLEDITPCPMTVAVLEELEKKIRAMQNNSQISKNNVNNEYKSPSLK